MNFAFSDEQEEFRKSLRRFLEDKSPSSEVRRAMETPEGFDPSLWKQMGQQLGLQGLRIEEAHGGQGFGFLELEIAMEEMGRVLLCAPFFSTVCLAANAVANAGTPERQSELLPRLASGETLATLALLESSGRWGVGDIELVARPRGERFEVSGVKSLVSDGQTADWIVVAARLDGSRGEDGVVLLLVTRDADGIDVTPVETLDPTRRLARIEFRGALGDAIGDPGRDGPPLARTLDEATIALAAESAGGAERCLETAVAYASQRVQFARPIGSFQAIKHKCAEVLLEVEQAKATARWASWVADERPEQLAEAASIAKSVAGEAYLRASRECVQIHGGIGFTWEADPQLFFKRAKANEVLLGDPVEHRARLIRSQGL